MRTVGYRQVWQYLSGQIDYEQMLELIPIATNQLAKRQLTWLRTWKEAIWFDSNSAELTSVVLNAIKF
ncbi:MAG: tRNA delta(2)-isopentenylpyrophosphate transferase, partial [uncultured bacterium]